MTATTHKLSAIPAADPPGGADGLAAVAPSAAPRRGDRVFDAGRGRWFVHSNSVAGAWWKVEMIPGQSLTCSCPAGLRAGTNLNARPCRHKRAVAAAAA